MLVPYLPTRIINFIANYEVFDYTEYGKMHRERAWHDSGSAAGITLQSHKRQTVGTDKGKNRLNGGWGSLSGEGEGV